MAEESATIEVQEIVENVNLEVQETIENVTLEIHEVIENVALELQENVENVTLNLEENVENVLIEIQEVRGRTGPVGPVGPAGSGEYLKEILSGVIDGVNVDFTTQFAIEINTETVFINGLAQFPELHYTVNGNIISLDEPAEVGDRLTIIYTKE